MAGQLRTFTVAATTRDTEHWSADDSATFVDDHDYVIDKLGDALQATADRFRAEHPSVFACEITVN